MNRHLDAAFPGLLVLAMAALAWFNVAALFTVLAVAAVVIWWKGPKPHKQG
jgi:hypothetical protein